MTDQEKIVRHDAIGNLREWIGGCFGAADGIFAGHPEDEKRTKELCEFALINKITLHEVQEIVLGYMYRQKYESKHIEQQYKRSVQILNKNFNSL